MPAFSSLVTAIMVSFWGEGNDDDVHHFFWHCFRNLDSDVRIFRHAGQPFSKVDV